MMPPSFSNVVMDAPAGDSFPISGAKAGLPSLQSGQPTPATCHRSWGSVFGTRRREGLVRTGNQGKGAVLGGCQVSDCLGEEGGIAWAFLSWEFSPGVPSVCRAGGREGR